MFHFLSLFLSVIRQCCLQGGCGTEGRLSSRCGGHVATATRLANLLVLSQEGLSACLAVTSTPPTTRKVPRIVLLVPHPWIVGRSIRRSVLGLCLPSSLFFYTLCVHCRPPARPPSWFDYVTTRCSSFPLGVCLFSTWLWHWRGAAADELFSSKYINIVGFVSYVIFVLLCSVKRVSFCVCVDRQSHSCRPPRVHHIARHAESVTSIVVHKSTAMVSASGMSLSCLHSLCCFFIRPLGGSTVLHTRRPSPYLIPHIDASQARTTSTLHQICYAQHNKS